MSKTVRPILEALFAHRGEPGQLVAFDWRLVRKNGRPFLLLPQHSADIRTGLYLYSAQRQRAKIWRALLPAMIRMPVASLFERVSFQADTASEMMRFMAQQSGIPAGELATAAIKVSEVGNRSRLVMLLCDESGRPTRVIKAGLNAAGKAATDREADLLEKLPPHTLGCIRMTGRLSAPTLSAFATDYFPGESPNDDAGMEHLFHAWLSSDSPVAIEALPLWRGLTANCGHLEYWPSLNQALAGKRMRTTLYHGDFAPWNTRVVNSQNLEAFDWERGTLQGIPGWDWFHFIVQTAILARRHSVPRVAAEVEQLLASARFQKYAEAAGISEIVQPLVLAYLLHQCWVIKPLDGGKATAELFEFLFTHWQMEPDQATIAVVTEKPTAIPQLGLLSAVREQLQSAAEQWSNLFWEPSLNSAGQPPLRAQFQLHWPVVLLASLLLATVIAVQFFSSVHLTFLPFYLAICAGVTWKTGRRWGVYFATVAAVLSPLVVGLKGVEHWQLTVMLWNGVMRFIVLQMGVLFVSRIRQQKDFPRHHQLFNGKPVKLAETWAIVMGSGLVFIGAMIFDLNTDPQLMVLPFYLFPCMVLTLALNLRWGMVAAVIANLAEASIEYLASSTHHYTAAEVFGWNFIMRLAISLLVVVLLNRIRSENILFSTAKPKRV